MVAIERQVALLHLKRLRRDWNEYQAEVEDAHKHGFRPEFCFHGTPQWVDYDPICGGCEDGFTGWNPLAFARSALARAKVDVAEYHRRTAAVIDLISAGFGDTAALEPLWAWTHDPIKIAFETVDEAPKDEGPAETWEIGDFIVYPGSPSFPDWEEAVTVVSISEAGWQDEWSNPAHAASHRDYGDYMVSAGAKAALIYYEERGIE